MLKIKDDVDLKELEKFGFVKYQYRENHSYYMYPDIKNYQLYIFIENRQIFTNDIYNEKPLVVLYDLIQAGLVEKPEQN